MARRFDTHYRMKDGKTRLSEAYFNAIFSDLDLRLHSQEEVEKSWQAAVAELNEFGLSRINEFLAPLIEQFQSIASMGFMTATLQGDDAILFELGPKTVQINEGAERTYFPAPPFVALQVGTDADLYAIARCITYDRETGALALDVISRSAATVVDPGPYAGVSVSVLPGGMAALQDILSEAEGHRIVSEVSAAAAGVSAAALATALTATQDMRDEVEDARDYIFGLVSGATRIVGQPVIVPGGGQFVMTTIGSGGSTTVISGAADRIDLYPFVPGADLSIDTLGVNCTTAVAGAACKVVAYSSLDNGHPDALLLETGTIDLSTLGNKTASASLTLEGGKTYWLGVRHSLTAGVSAWPLQSTPDLNGGSSMLTTARKTLRRNVTFASAAPSPWGFNSDEITAFAAPAVWLRMA